LGVVIAGACSSSGNIPRGTGSGSGTDTSSGSGGAGQGVGSSGTIGLGAGGSIIIGGSSGAGGDDGGLKPCQQNSDCGTNALCIDGTCRPIGNGCTSDADCPGDQRCCGAGCRTDGKTDGVCVPNDGVDKGCKKDQVAIGVFAPSLQCQWKGPQPGDPFPGHNRVMATPLVADLPNDSGAAAEIIIVTSDESSGAGRGDVDLDPRGPSVDPRYGMPARGGVIRILNGQTCDQVEVISTGTADTNVYVRGPATPAVADLDNDGTMEIVARVHNTDETSTDTRIVAFKWNATSKKYEQYWMSASGTGPLLSNGSWDGVSIHDLDNDGFPEVIARFGTVFNGRTGATIAPFDQNIAVTADPVLGDVDVDGQVELVANKVFKFTGSGWTQKYPGPNMPANAAAKFYAFADFGTPGATPDAFDFKKLDGKAEIVTTGSIGDNEATGQVSIFTLSGQQILSVQLPNTGGVNERGGPPTIGDFDKDGFPEIASAGASAFRVFDPDCKGGGAGCIAPFIRWSQPSHDVSSAQTGSSIFDFEGDGQAEAVYADECFLRVYAGNTGEVRFSAFRQSCTWLENPTIADPDRDTRTEIIVNSNINCAVTSCPEIDPIDPGVRCEKNEDCYGMNCASGFCRCTKDSDCSAEVPKDPAQFPSWRPEGPACTAPLAGTAGTGNVCRARHPTSMDPNQLASFNTVKVYRDVLDRWSDSRPMWNQHAYSITNINDDGTVPASGAWKQNFSDPKLNNYRQNRQGGMSATLLPDITGQLDKNNVCTKKGATLIVTGRVCNRGLRVVGADMPASFYLGPPSDGHKLCTSYTSGPVQLGNQCLPVSCSVMGADVTAVLMPGVQIYMVVNDDGMGHATTEECNTMNNVDMVSFEQCPDVN
jgi:hypothetical protein